MIASRFCPRIQRRHLLRRSQRRRGRGAAAGVSLRRPGPHVRRRPGPRQPHGQRPARARRRSRGPRARCSAWTRRSSSARSGARSRSARCRFRSTRSCGRATTRYLLHDSRARVAIVSAPLLREAEAGAGASAVPARTCSSPAATPGRHRSFEDADGARVDRADAGADLARRCRVLALLVGLDRLSRRAPCTCTTTWSSATETYAQSACSASARATASTRQPSSSSPTASATPATFRWASARRASSLRSGRPRAASSRS